MTPLDPSRPLLSVRRLRVYHRQRGWLQRARTVKAVDDVHFDLRAGEVLGVVGEAGAGKSSLLRALLGEIAVTAGSVAFAGQERARRGKTELAPAAALAGIAQSAARSSGQWLGRRMRVSRILGDALKRLDPKRHAGLDKAGRRAASLTALRESELSEALLDRSFGELSALQKAQLLLCRALLAEPAVLICDGPIEGLEAEDRRAFSVALSAAQARHGFALIVAAREFGALPDITGRVLVLSVGRTLEQGPTAEVTHAPAHPYTRRLLKLAAGVALDERTEEGELLADREAPRADNPPMGCVFHTRCGLVERACVQSVPLLKRTLGADHYAACHFAPVPE